MWWSLNGRVNGGERNGDQNVGSNAQIKRGKRGLLGGRGADDVVS